jgi:hypothetical protein
VVGVVPETNHTGLAIFNLIHTPGQGWTASDKNDSNERKSGGAVKPGTLCQDFRHDEAMDVGEAELAAVVGEGELFMVEPEQVEDGGVEVVHVDRSSGHGAAEFVGFTEGESWFHAGAGEPDGEGIGIVVAAGAIFFGVRGAPEFAAPPDQGVLEKPALFQVHEQAGDGFVDGGGMVGVFRQV